MSFKTFALLGAFSLLLFPTVSFAQTFTSPLTQGSSGPEVTALQQLLQLQGYLNAEPTGYFGPLTSKAVAAFQTAHLLEAVGSVGPLTRAALNSVAGTTTTPISNTSGLVITTTLDIGSKGSEVSALQQYLKSLELYTYPEITGYFGTVTQQAVMAYQTLHGLEPVGAVGPKTRAALAVGVVTNGQNSGSTTPATTTASTTPLIPAPIAPGNGYTPGFGGGGTASTPAATPDTTVPTVSLTAPTNGATLNGSITLSATASDDVAVAGVTFKVGGVVIGSEDTSSPYSVTWDSTATSSGAKSIVAVARDTSGNLATSTAISITTDNTAPALSSVSGSVGTTVAVISWTTDKSSTSKVVYGLTTSYGSASTSASLVTSHSITLTGLSSATTYHYAVVSADSLGNTATSSDQTFTTNTAGLSALTTSKASADTSNPQTAGLYATPPTVTMSTTSPSATYTVQYPSTTVATSSYVNSFEIDGGLPYISGGKLLVRAGSSAGASTNWATGAGMYTNTMRLHFTADAQDFVIKILDGGAGNPMRFRLIVDGKYTSTTTGYTTDGTDLGFRYFTVDFGSKASRDIQIEFNANPFFVALMRRSTDTLAKATTTVPTLLFEGDSISVGAINNPTSTITKAAGQIAFNGDSIARRAADLLGTKAVIAAIGGTGYKSGSASSTYAGDRIQDFANEPWDAAVVLLGINDKIAINGAGMTRATFQGYVNDYVLRLAQAYPNKPIAIGGAFYNSSLVGAGATPTGVNPDTDVDIQAAVTAALAAVPTARIGFFAVDDLINGSGSVAAPAGDGTADTYLNSDKTHPTTAGELYQSSIIAQRIYSTIQGL